jgi:hypothetical protein
MSGPHYELAHRRPLWDRRPARKITGRTLADAVTSWFLDLKWPRFSDRRPTFGQAATGLPDHPRSAPAERSRTPSPI